MIICRIKADYYNIDWQKKHPAFDKNLPKNKKLFYDTLFKGYNIFLLFLDYKACRSCVNS